ncbi:MAG: DUF3500 domain-containing protein [Acidimicrobiia bacterium]|nr:DUF3500 domain-containing protein [Acidimicrobiia bacterium]
MAEVSVDRLREAALALRDAIGDADLRARLVLPFEGEQERRNWMYWPAPRQGVPFSDLLPDQQQLAYGVVAAVLSLPAYAKVTTIIGLEEVLREMELGGRGRRRPGGLPRDPTKYYTTLFGDVAGPGPWGWRFEGHHVSVHLTVVDGEVAATPLFLGSNPAEVRHGDRVVLRPLAEEEDTARALLAALPADQRRRALLDDRAPDDILTFNSPRVEVDLEGGVAVADLGGSAREIAAALIELHADRVQADLRVAADAAGVHFAWAGSPERGRHHYYRLAGPRFLVEYDNTQNDANHAHSVWRDPGNDFGDDLLRRHLAEDHSTTA